MKKKNPGEELWANISVQIKRTFCIFGIKACCSSFTVRIQAEEHKEKEGQHRRVHRRHQGHPAQKEEGQTDLTDVGFMPPKLRLFCFL